jgi:hypothetical protein
MDNVSIYIVRLIKSETIAWPGHVMRIDEKRTLKSVLEWKQIGRRIRVDQGKDGLRTLKKIYR